MTPTFPPAARQLTQALVENARLLASRELLVELFPKNAVIAEAGVGLGDFSRLILDVCQPSVFVAIDEFKLHELQALWGRPALEIFAGDTHEEFYRRRFAGEIRDGVLQIQCGDSADRLRSLDDESLDVAYIDADHRYEFVSRDLDAVLPKLRPDGWLVMNDYIMVAEMNTHEHYGVVHATHEFMLKNDWGIQYLALNTRMFCDVALRPNLLLKSQRMETDRLIAHADAMRLSRSWKVTAPLRALSRLVTHR